MKCEDDSHDRVASGVMQAGNETTETASKNDTSDLNISDDRDGAEKREEMNAMKRHQDENNSDGRHDPYRYIARDGGTSCELFKIEIHNVPRYTSYTTLKKLFVNKLHLKPPKKIKLIGNPVKFAFVAFSDENERKAAIESISGFMWKGCELQAAVAGPKADPLELKRMRDEENECPDGKKTKVEARETGEKKEGEDCKAESSISHRLNDQVASLWRLPYAEQLLEKTKIVNEFLIDLHKSIGRMIDHSKTEPAIASGQYSKDQLFKWYLSSKRDFDRKPCLCNQIQPSPVVDGYRNKCEFSIGTDKTVGFRLGSYKNGSLVVAPVDDCPIVSPAMKNIVLVIQKFFRETSKLLPFDAVTHENNWKQVMIRTSSNGSSLVVLSLDVKGLSEEQILTEKQLLKDSLSNDPSIDSLYLESVGENRKKSAKNNQPLDLLFGKPFLTEQMTIHGKDLSFNVSPDAFFQINTPAAQVCYEKIAELLDLKNDVLLLDVCCGTGTIGISLADRVSEVIGIELNADAVRDAERNAATNNVKNIKFMSGKAEDLVVKVVSSTHPQEKYKEIIAIIDPPRAGLNQSVMKALRSAEKLDRIIYVSCDPRFAKQNLVDLCRPASKMYKGVPFVPVSVTPIDMFPHTNRCEVIFVFERLKPVVKEDLNAEK